MEGRKSEEADISRAPETDSVFNVFCIEKCVLKSSKECFIKAYVSGSSVSENEDFIFVPNYHENIAIANSVCRTERDGEYITVPVQVMNLSHEDILLKKGVFLGYIEPVIQSEKVFLVSEGKEVGEKEYDFNIGENDYSTEEKKQFMKLLKENGHIFSSFKGEVGHLKGVKHRIETRTDKPVIMRHQRIPLAMEEKVEKMISDMLKQNIIVESKSEWNSPLVVVPKKNGDLRLCVDFRKLNSITVRPQYPMPNTHAMFDSLQGNRYFSTLDLSSGYHHVAMDEEDAKKTGFSSRSGHYHYVRMPFGLSGAPATFQRSMNLLLRGLTWEKCLVYMDDVLIFGRTLKEHNERLQEVFQRFSDAGVKLSVEKCHFLEKEVRYLGHVISYDGIKTDPVKTECIRKYERPSTSAELKSFLGLTGYYRRFIYSYADLARPLENMLNRLECKRKDKCILEWDERTLSAFEQLKHALMSAPVLKYPIKNGLFVLDTDASHDCIGAVLSQVQDGQEKVIAYGSRALTKCEKAYCVTRKELLSVYYFCKYFKHYLLGQRFKIRTDHKALTWMLNWERPNTSQYCLWKAELQHFDMEVEYRKGKENVNADFVSRLKNCQQCEIEHKDPKRKRNVKILEASVEALDESKNVIIDSVVKLIENWDCRENIGKNSYIESIWKLKNNLFLNDGKLYFRKNGTQRLVVDEKQINEIINEYHSQIGHLGINKTHGLLKDRFYWPNMKETINRVLKMCIPCQIYKEKLPHKRSELILDSTSQCFERIGIDICGPFKVSRNGYKYIIGIIDYYSKFPVLVPCRSPPTSKMLIQKLFRHWISYFGMPRSIHSDGAAYFTSNEFRMFCDKHNVLKTTSTPYYAQSNGLIERLFKTVKPLLYATVESHNTDWDDALPRIEMGLRASKHSITGSSPFEVVFGKNMTLPLDVDFNFPRKRRLEKEDIDKAIRDCKERANERQKRYDIFYTRNTKPLSVGAKVMIEVSAGCRVKEKYEGPYIVRKCVTRWKYILEHVVTHERKTRNFNQVKLLRTTRTTRSS